ncbi:MAG: Trm112 family protein [Chloroflexi bacterium]|nr:Trm112 family protein [Chloroflexota bacterium]
MTISNELLEILRCPVCVQEADEAGLLELVNDTWLVCQTCERKYPIRDDIPVMLIDEGTRWQKTPVDELPATAPEPVD